MSSPYLLKGFYKKGPGGNSQLVKFGSDAIILENGTTLTGHVNDRNAHLPFSDIENAIIQRIHTTIGRVLDGGDGSTLLNKHATMKLLSDDIIAVTDTVNGFLNDLADGGVIDRLSDIVVKLSTHDTDILSIREDISILPSLVSQLNSATANIITHTNELDLLSTNVDTLLPLLDSYVTMSGTLVEIQTSINNINDTIVVVPTLSDTVASHTATLTELNDTLNSTIASVDSLLPLVDSYNTLLSVVTGHTTDIATLQTNIDTINSNITSIDGEVTSISGNLSDVTDIVVNHGVRLSVSETDIGNLTTTMNTNTSDIHVLESSLISQATDIATAQQSANSAIAAAATNAADIDIVESNLAEQATTISSIDTTLSDLSGVVSTHTTEIADINTDITGLTSVLDTTNTRVETLEVSQASQDLSIQNINNSLSTIDAEIDILESSSNSNTSAILGLTSVVQETQDIVTAQGESIDVLSSEVATVTDTVEGIVNNISPRIIGIAHFPGTNSLSNFRHINEHGNFLVGFKYYTSPIYQEKMRDVVIGDDQMKEIDTLYVKTAASGPEGTDSEGRKCWWISPDPVPGFRPMLAFKRDGVIKPHVYLGKYMGYYSIPDVQPTTGYNRYTYESSISTYKNSGDATGFRIMDIYDLGLLRLLLLIFGGGPDVRTVWGDNVNNDIRPNNGTTGARAFGIYDLWRSYHYLIDKIKVSRYRKIELTNPYTGEIIYTDLDMPYSTSNRYISEIVVGDLEIGPDIHNYMELFLPAAYVSDVRDAAYMDGVRFTSSSTTYEKDVYIGGSPRDSNSDYIAPSGANDKTKMFCGIFMCVMEHDLDNTSSYASMRLAKS